MSTINPIAKIGDIIRGSLLADRPEQIPLLLESVTKRVTALGGKFYIKNFWDDPKPLSLGYVGVHIKIRMPIPLKNTNETSGHDQTGLVNQERKYILMELQLHVREIMDGTKDCAKEIAHLLYKAPQESEEKISQEIISSSQLVYLTAMTKLLSSKEDLKRVEGTLKIIQAMTKADKKMRLVLATAMLLHNKELDGEWNEQLQVVVPRDKDAVASAWMSTAQKISKLLNLPTVKMDERDVWTNTATSVDELYANAKQIASFFRDMCKQAADSQPGCSVNFGPADAHMIKEKKSLQDKIKADWNEELGRFMTQFLMKIERSLSQITESDSVHLGSLTALQSLNFSGCSQITDNDLGFLGSLSALQRLRLSECSQITDEGLAYLERLTGLRSLNLSGCRITDRGLAYLENLTGLQSLNLSGCRITDRGLAHLWCLTGLQSLNIYGCNEITDSGLARAGLQSLNFSRQIPNPVNPSQSAQSSQSPAVSDSTRSIKDDYFGLLLSLLENTSIQSDSSLVEILGSQVEELMSQETQVLTSKQKNSYSWIQKLLINEKVSQFVAKNLRKLHAPEEGKSSPVVLHTSDLSSQTPSALPKISKNLASSKVESEAAFQEMKEILIKAEKSLFQITGLESLSALKSLDLSRSMHKKPSKSQITDNDLARLGSLIPTLQSLNLYYCDQITDTGIAGLISLTALESLDLSYCKQITDRGLASLGSLTALQHLVLTFCTQITDSGLASLSSLTALQHLVLSCCTQITNSGLASLSSLTALQSLNLQRCDQITDRGRKDWVDLDGLTSLKSLNLQRYDQITDRGRKDWVDLGGLISLKSLNLANCEQITDRDLAHLWRLTALQSLNLSYCKQFTDSGLAGLSGLTSLKSLDLSYCEQITDRGLACLGSLTALESLNLYGCKQITDRGLASLGSLTGMKSLDLRYCDKITDRGLVGLTSLIALQSLIFVESDLITDKGLASLGSLTTLESLNLYGCKQITDSGLASLENLTGLRTLCLAFCNQITDRGLAGLVSCLTALQTLDLRGCDKLTDNGLACLTGLTALQTLRLGECYQITGKGLIGLGCLTALRSLDLGNSTQITDRDLASLTNLIALQCLVLSGCNQITDRGLASLRSLTALHVLQFSNCKQITDSGLADLTSLTALQSLALNGCDKITDAAKDRLRIHFNFNTAFNIIS